MGDVAASFDSLAGKLDYPMLIVTAASGGQRAGCLVGFATQASIDPPRYLVCLSERNLTFRIACGSDALAVHVATEQAADLAALFGERTGDEVDKFAACRWHLGPRGLPILDDCPMWFAGDVLGRLPLGDHAGFLLAPIAVEDRGGFEQLSFQRLKGLSPGHPA